MGAFIGISGAKHQLTGPRLEGSNPGQGALNLTEAHCEEGAV